MLIRWIFIIHGINKKNFFLIICFFLKNLPICDLWMSLKLLVYCLSKGWSLLDNFGLVKVNTWENFFPFWT